MLDRVDIVAEQLLELEPLKSKCGKLYTLLKYVCIIFSAGEDVSQEKEDEGESH